MSQNTQLSSRSDDRLVGQTYRSRNSTPETRRMRILYVSHVGLLGGAERSLLDLIAALDRERHCVRVVLPSVGEFSERLRSMNVPFDVCPFLGRLRRSASLPERTAQAFRLIAGGMALRSLSRAHSPVIVHANSTTAAFYEQCLPWATAVPTIWHFRDLDLSQRIGRMLARRCATIVVPSTSCRDVVSRVADGDKVVLIPNGIDLGEGMPPAKLARRGSELRSIKVSVIGQLAKWKGHMLAIEAARQVVPRCPDVDFLIVGDDRLESLPLTVGELKRRVDAVELAGRVTVTGHRDDVRQILEHTDILLHPAFPEPAGRVVMEAMAAGCPVIAFDGQHGPAEIVRQGIDGLLVSPRSAHALADAVMHLAQDAELRERMGRAARSRAVAQFDRALMAQRMQELYRSLAPAAESV